jgi:hypothetical protein
MTAKTRAEKLGATLTVVLALLLGWATFAGATTHTLPGNPHYRAVISAMAGPGLSWSAQRNTAGSFAFASKNGIEYLVGSSWVVMNMTYLTGLPKGEESKDVTLILVVTLMLAGSSASTWVENHAAKSAVGRVGSWRLQTTFLASGRGSFLLELVHS